MRSSIFTTSSLHEQGVGDAHIARAVAAGTLVRIRTGWYALPQADPDVVAAVVAGGSLTCGDALRRHGLWVLNHNVHIRVSPDSRRHSSGVAQVHRLPGYSLSGVDDLLTAFQVAQRCMSRDELACCIDSALNSGAVTGARLTAVLTTAKGRDAMSCADPLAESGVETLARLALRSIRIRTRSQVQIAGVGRVDLLVGERLVIELDGDEWHSSRQAREADRQRDSALVASGRLVIRAGYQRVVNERAMFLSEVSDVVHRREHLWRSVHRR